MGRIARWAVMSDATPFEIAGDTEDGVLTVRDLGRAVVTRWPSKTAAGDASPAEKTPALKFSRPAKAGWVYKLLFALFRPKIIPSCFLALGQDFVLSETFVDAFYRSGREEPELGRKIVHGQTLRHCANSKTVF
jgi:hypothetical protein